MRILLKVSRLLQERAATEKPATVLLAQTKFLTQDKKQSITVAKELYWIRPPEKKHPNHVKVEKCVWNDTRIEEGDYSDCSVPIYQKQLSQDKARLHTLVLNSLLNVTHCRKRTPITDRITSLRISVALTWHKHGLCCWNEVREYKNRLTLRSEDNSTWTLAQKNGECKYYSLCWQDSRKRKKIHRATVKTPPPDRLSKLDAWQPNKFVGLPVWTADRVST